VNHAITVRARATLLVPALLAACLALAIAAPRANADATITVSTTADPGTGACTPTNGQCTLREALELVNEGEVSGWVNIMLDASGTIDVGPVGELVLEPDDGVEAVEVYGPGAANLTIDGGGESRVLLLEKEFFFSLTNVTIAHGAVTDFAVDGDGGAGIFSEASEINLSGVRFTENRVESDRDGGAIGIEGAAHLTVWDSVFEGNFSERSGGAIFVETDGTAYVSGTTIEENEAEERDGGGVAVKVGLLTLVESTVAGNTAGDAGGGVATTGPVGFATVEKSTVAGNLAARGAGIAQLEGELLLRDSTVTANQGGGVYDEEGVLTVRNSTIVANTSTAFSGAGIEGDEFVLQSTIVAGNERNSSPADCAGTVTSEGNNLVGTAFGSLGCSWPPGLGDHFGLDPELGPLGSYGGPTATMPPVSRESPAINNGENPQETDQRGLTRPVPGTAADTDVGAIEVQAPEAEAGDPPAITPAVNLKVGDELTCEPGGWDTDTVTDPSFSFSWRVEGTPAASGTTYELTNADAGKPISCEVTVDNGVLAASAESSTVELDPAVATISPITFDFGSRSVKAGPSAAQALVVENQGGAELEVVKGTTTNPEFQIDDSACEGVILEPGGTCEIEVTFDPQAPGAQSSFVAAETSAGNPVATVSGQATDFTFSASPAAVDFGEQLLGTTSAEETIVVSNLGDAPMTLGEVELEGEDTADFARGADTCSDATLGAGEECTVEVTFTPTAIGARGASLAFGGETTGAVALAGTGVAPVLAISPTPLSYGSHLVGTKSAVQPFVVTNVGSAPAEIDNVELAGTNSDQFELGATDTCTDATLEPDEECTVDVTFAPTVVGSASAFLLASGNAPTASATLEGSAFGEPEFAADPTALDFGEVLVSGGASSPLTVTVTNGGTAAMEIDEVEIEGADGAAFAIAPGGDDCGGAELAPAAECTVDLTFDPSAARGFAATIAFSGDDDGTVGLEGTGIAPELTIAPSPLDYGLHQVGSKSGVQPFVVKNVGTAPATLGTVTLGGAKPGQFLLGPTNTCSGATLAPSAECTVDVTFVPTEPGLSVASLQIPGDAPAAATLEGTGTEPTFSAAPSSLDFGTLNVEDAPGPAQTVVITNTGTGAMEIGPIFRAGDDPDMFVLEDDECSNETLAASEECEVKARFAPTGSGSFTASIVFPGTAPGTVALEGTGVGPEFWATPTSVDFGTREVGSGAGPTQTVKITNEGTAAMEIGTVTLDGPNPTSFAVAPAGDGCSDETLAAGASCTVQAAFAPVQTGDLGAELSFPGNAPGAVVLHGFGSEPLPAPQPEPALEPEPQPEPDPGISQLALKPPKGALKVGSKGRAAFKLVCDSPGGTACQGTLTLSAGKRIGRWHGKVGANATRKVSIQLSHAAREELRERGKLRIVADLAGTGGEKRTNFLLKRA
jgi:predicted outer membrane repeat protein